MGDGRIAGAGRPAENDAVSAPVVKPRDPVGTGAHEKEPSR